MVEFLQFTLSGISFGMIYAAIALSLVLIWRGTRLLNFAQGGMAMFTTYIALEVVRHTGSYWAGFVVALAAGIVLGTVAELAVIRPALGRPELNSVIITIGLLILIEGLAGYDHAVTATCPRRRPRDGRYCRDPVVKLNAFRDYQIAEIAAEVTAVAGLTVLTGLSGQISLGNGAFMAIGAYTTALVLLHLGWPFVAVLVVAAAVTAVAGAIVGVAAARLHGPYLAGATLMLGVALPSLAYAYPGVFGGDQGLNVVFTTPGFLGVNFPPTRWQAWISSAVALVTLVLLANLGRSRVGRNWRAVRDDEVAAALAGVNVARARILAFVVSATCAGMAGALLAIVTGLVAPGAFTITLSIALLTAAVIGGLGTLPGALWGSLVIVLVPTYATDVATSHGLSTAVASNIPVAAYGVVLIVVMLIFPQGIQGGVRWLLGLLGIPSARTWHPASMSEARSPAGDTPASQHEALLTRRVDPPEPHKKEGTQ